MRIVQASKAYFPHLGGIETIVRQLAEGFAQRQGFDSRVIVCSDDRHSHTEYLHGVHVRREATLTRIASLPISPTYPLGLLRETGDVLHIHEPSLLPAATYSTFFPLARCHFRRLVVWWHSDIVRQRTFSLLYRSLLRLTLRHADAIIVATPQHITSSSFLPEFRNKCHVIHYGIDPVRFALTPTLTARIDQIRVKYGTPLILFIGRLVYYKGAEYLVRAMHQLPEARLVIVGSGPLESELVKLVAQGPNNTTIIPFLDDQAMIAMLHACDIFVLPSVENSEAFGIVQLEAMACGKPVITADLATGVTYVNQAGQTGLVVPKRNPDALAQAIGQLIADLHLYQRLGATAQARVLRDFTIDGMINQTIKLYQDIL